MRFFPANAKSAIVLEPGDGAFDGPASFGASQGSAILGLGAIEPVGCNHFDSMSGQERVETVTIVSFVPDDSRRCRLRNDETKELLDEMAFGGVGWGAASGHRQPLSVNEDHDLDALADPSATDAIAPTFGFGKSAIDETFVEAESPGVFHTATSGSHQGLENTRIDPLEKPAVNRALRTKTGRKVLPFRSVIEHPKNARNHLSLIGGRSPSLRTSFRIRYLPRKPIQLLFAKCQHSDNLAFTMPYSGFGIACRAVVATLLTAAVVDVIAAGAKIGVVRNHFYYATPASGVGIACPLA